MSLSFFHLREQPFGDTPDPRFLFKSESHSRTLATMLRYTKIGERLQIVVAPPGSGKTMLLFALLHELGERAHVALVTNSILTSAEFINFLLRTFNIDPGGPNPDARRALLHEFLSRSSRAGVAVILIVDEAQNLPLPVLREIRMLVEHAPDCLQVILAGQPELEVSLHEPSVAILLNAIPHRLRPLDAKETAAYIQHRLAVAGYSGPDLFTPDAIRAIARESKGVPRVINMFCFEAMLQASLQQTRVINRELLLDAVQHFNLLETTVETPRHITPTRGANAMKPAPVSEPRRTEPTAANMPQERNESKERGPVPVPSPTRDKDQSATFAPMLRAWLERSARSWTGTASEFLQVIANVDAKAFQQISSLSTRELLAYIESNAGALRSLGVELEIRNRPGSPRLISLRLTDGGAAVPASPEPVPEARKQPATEPRSSAPSRTRLDAPAHRDEGKEIASTVPSPAAVIVEDAEPDAKTSTPDTRHSTDLPGLHLLPDIESPVSVEENRPPLWQRIDRLYVTVAVGMLLVFLVLIIYATHATTHAATTPRSIASSLPPADAQAISQLQRDAESGKADAQYDLGLRYASGNGIPQSTDDAIKWLRRAAEQGQADAQFELGSILALQDVVAGYPWLVLANEAGVDQSRELLADLTPKLSNSDIGSIRYELGEMFSNGVGIERNDVTAYTWFQLAQAAGDKRAAPKLADLRSRMGSDEVTEASRRADDWLRQHTK